MDEELKVYLDGMKSDMHSMKSDMLGMKNDMLDMKRELIAHTDASISELREHMDASLDQAKRELREHTETVETRLLGEFFKWARTSDLRYRQGHAVVGALDDRV